MNDLDALVIILSDKLNEINFDKKTKTDINLFSAYFVAPKGSSEFLKIILKPNNLPTIDGMR